MRRRDHRGILVGTDVAQEHDELVAAEPRDVVLRAHDLAQARCDRAQQAIAGRMAERVVDLLELIEVDEQQRRQVRPVVRIRELALDFVLEADPVGQPGQLVEAREVIDARLRVASLGDVLHQHDGAAVGHRLERPLQRAPADVLRLQRGEFGCLGALDRGADCIGISCSQRPRAGTGSNNVAHRGVTMDLIVAQPHHFGKAPVDHGQRPIGGEHAQAVRHVVQCGVELRSDCGLPLAGQHGIDIDFLQKLGDPPHAEEEQHVQHGEADVVGITAQPERERHRATGDQDLKMKDPWPPVGASRTGGRVGNRHRGRQHVSDRVVGMIDRDPAPQAHDRAVAQGADLIFRLPRGRRGELHRQRLVLVLMHLPRAKRADQDNGERNQPQEIVAGLVGRQNRSDRGTQRAEKHWRGIREQRIDQGRVDRRRQGDGV